MLFYIVIDRNIKNINRKIQEFEKRFSGRQYGEPDCNSLDSLFALADA